MADKPKPQPTPLPTVEDHKKLAEYAENKLTGKDKDDKGKEDKGKGKGK